MSSAPLEVRFGMMELNNWTIFSLLDREFAAQIRLACVFGKTLFLAFHLIYRNL